MEEIPPPSTLRRRNSIATTTTSIITSDIDLSPSSFDLDLISLKPSSFVAYTSLRDILTSPGTSSSSSMKLPAINGSSSSVGDISIRNRLVKQAAWSYLQPSALTSSEGSPGSQFLRRVWANVSAGIQFLRRVFDWILQSLRIPLIVR